MKAINIRLPDSLEIAVQKLRVERRWSWSTAAVYLLEKGIADLEKKDGKK